MATGISNVSTAVSDSWSNGAMKIISADKVKKLPVGTDVYIVNESTGKSGLMWIIKSGRKKLLKGILSTHEIKDTDGWHYEVDE